MNYRCVVALISIVAFGGILNADDPKDLLSIKKESWRKSLEKWEFMFPESRAGSEFSLTQYTGDCQLKITADPDKAGGYEEIAFKLVQNTKEILLVRGY